MTVLDSAESRRAADMDTDSECGTSVLNESSQNCANKPSERRVVKIVPAASASQNHQHCLSSPPTSQADVQSSSVIDRQESVRIRVRFIMRACFILFD